MMTKHSMKLATLAISAIMMASTAQADQHAMSNMDISQMKMGDTAEEEITFGESGKSSDVSRTITVTISDLVYDLKDLKVKNGETIRFIIVNKDEMEHEFTLGQKEMQATDRANMAKQSDAGQSMEMAVPYAVSVADLETKELIWKFKGPQKIEFDCNVPGHYESGMTGNITITE